MRHSIANPVNENIYDHLIANPADPAAGAPLDAPCPGNARARVNQIYFTFATIGAGFFPLVYILPLAGSDQLFAGSNTAPNAFTTTGIVFSTGIVTTWYDAASNRLYVPLSTNVILEPGDFIRLTCTGITAAQQISNIHIGYDQWIIA